MQAQTQTQTPTFTPSAYQEAVFSWITDSNPSRRDAMVNAVAGSGKTTTLVHAARLISRPGLFCAFNKHVADTLEARLLGTRMVASTIHRIGMRILYDSLGRRPQLNDNKYFQMVRAYVKEYRGDFKDDKHALARLNKLCRFVRLTLTDPADSQAMLEMTERYNLEMENGDVLAVRSLLAHGDREAEENGDIDFTDMLWLPHKLKLMPRPYSFVFVDECQDLNRAQLDLVLKCRQVGGRSLWVGDPNQAIMAFAGADSESYQMIRDGLEAEEFPLSICYRCPRDVITLAQELVPHIQPRPGAPRGTVVEEYDEYRIVSGAREKDLIMCRRNAPLIRHCLRLIANGIHARVRGREIGKELADLVRAIGSNLSSFARFPSAVQKYEEEQRAVLVARDASDAQLETLSDKCQALIECFDGFRSRSAEEMATKLENIFSDSGSAVWFSSIHRAKGLEAERTWILNYEKLGKGRSSSTPEEMQQERNLKYVALTRSLDTMHLMYEEKPEKQGDFEEEDE